MTAVVSEARFCSICGVQKSTPYCVACGADPNGVPADIEELASRPNWGAFLLPGVWPFWHGRPLTGVVWWVCLVGSLAAPTYGRLAAGLILAFGIACYLFLRGNRIALSRRQYRDLEDFLLTERSWAHWGVVVCGVCLGIVVALGVDAVFVVAGSAR
jgi:hypothetical protein